SLNVTSGVMSRGESPVPPVVSARSTRSSSVKWTSAAATASSSSGTTVRLTSRSWAAVTFRSIRSPLSSFRTPRKTPSLTVISPTRMPRSCNLKLPGDGAVRDGVKELARLVGRQLFEGRFRLFAKGFGHFKRVFDRAGVFHKLNHPVHVDPGHGGPFVDQRRGLSPPPEAVNGV